MDNNCMILGKPKHNNKNQKLKLRIIGEYSRF